MRSHQRRISCLTIAALTALLSTSWTAPLLAHGAPVPGGPCDLACPAAASCTFGSASTPGLNVTNVHGMHCACPDPRTTGVYCELPFASCGAVGQHVCYHGGVCQEGAVDQFGNTLLSCNCATAMDPVTKAPFAGKYCEFATVTTCDPNHPELFCLNGGVCNDMYP